jgi:two-component system sensor histidine kinase ChiS
VLIYISKQRFDDRLHIIWEVDADLQLMIPPLSIQPLVENAVRHGKLMRSMGGKIYIRIIDHKDRVEVTITDNGVGMDEGTLERIFDRRSDNRQGIGLSNVDRQLPLSYRNEP